MTPAVLNKIQGLNWGHLKPKACADIAQAKEMWFLSWGPEELSQRVNTRKEIKISVGDTDASSCVMANAFSPCFLVSICVINSRICNGSFLES